MDNTHLYGEPLPDNAEYKMIVPCDENVKYVPAMSFGSFAEMFDYAISLSADQPRKDTFVSSFYNDLEITVEAGKKVTFNGTVPGALADVANFGYIKSFDNINGFLYIVFDNGYARCIRLKKKLNGVKAAETQNAILMNTPGIKKVSVEIAGALTEDGRLIPVEAKDCWGGVNIPEFAKYAGQIDDCYRLGYGKYIIRLKDGSFAGTKGVASLIKKCDVEDVIHFNREILIKSKTGKYYVFFHDKLYPAPDVKKLICGSWIYCVDKDNRYMRLSNLLSDSSLFCEKVENVVDVLTLKSTESSKCDMRVFLFKDGSTAYDDIEEMFNEGANVVMRSSRGLANGPKNIGSIHFLDDSIVGVCSNIQNKHQIMYCQKMKHFAEITKSKFLDPKEYYIHSKGFYAMVEISKNDLLFIKRDPDLYNEFKDHPIFNVFFEYHKYSTISNRFPTATFPLPSSDDVDDIAATIDAIYYLKTKKFKHIRFIMAHDSPKHVTAATMGKYSCYRMDFKDDYFRRAKSIYFHETDGVEEADPDYVFEE